MIFVILAMSVFIADMAIKKTVEKKLRAGKTISLANDALRLRKIHNRGMAFNGLSDRQKLTQQLSGGFLLVWLIGFLRSLRKKEHTAEKAGRALVLGGGFSNWFDRYHQGYVTDYFNVRIPFRKIRKYYGNLSDVCIAVGMVLRLVKKRK